VGRHSGSSQTFQQPLRQVSTSESHSIETLQWLFEGHLHPELGTDIPRIDKSILAGGKTMSQHTMVAKPRGKSLSGQPGQITQGRDTQPTKSVDHLLSPHCFPKGQKIESGKEPNRVFDHMWLARSSRGGRPTSSKGAVGYPDKSFSTTLFTEKMVYSLCHSLGKRYFPSVEIDSTGHRDKQQTWRDHLNPRNQVLNHFDNRFETTGLIALVTNQNGCKGSEGLCIPTGHPESDTGHKNIFGCS
jgi:hypothetical protein